MASASATAHAREYVSGAFPLVLFSAREAAARGAPRGASGRRRAPGTKTTRAGEAQLVLNSASKARTLRTARSRRAWQERGTTS